MSEHCCEHMDKAIEDRVFEVTLGGDKGYRGKEDGYNHYNINGCCGGGCYVLSWIQYCPYCGSMIGTPTENC